MSNFQEKNRLIRVILVGLRSAPLVGMLFLAVSSFLNVRERQSSQSFYNITPCSHVLEVGTLQIILNQNPVMCSRRFLRYLGFNFTVGPN